MVMSINIKELLAMLMGKKSKGKVGDSEQKLLDMFDKIVFYGGDFENESIKTTVEFKFTDQNANALKQLFDMVNVMADGNSKAINLEGIKDMQADTTTLDTIEPVKNDNEPTPPTNPSPKVKMEKFTPPLIKKDEEIPPANNKTTKPKIKS
jgi:hypothetical protein